MSWAGHGQGPWQPVLELPERVGVVQCSVAPLAKTLVAVATEHSVFVYATHTDGARLALHRVASFLVGARAAALAWSPGAQYGQEDGVVRIELLAAVGDELRLLTATHDATSNAVLGTAGVRIDDVAWCAAPGYERYVAVGCADGVQLWDLEPADGAHAAVRRVLRLGAPVVSVAFHAHVPKLLLAVDASGVGRLVDWPAALDAREAHAVPTHASFADAPAVARHAAQGAAARGHAAWHAQDAEVVCAALGAHWRVWQVPRGGAARVVLQGAVPGGAAPAGAWVAWAPTNARLLAVGARAPCAEGGVQLIDTAFPQSPRTVAVHAQTARVPAAVDVRARGVRGAVRAVAEGVGGLAWLPQRVGGVEVLLVAVGARLVAVPAAT
ncbi:hypothetical protein MBRA1_001352 [Malassezia brasiliensis]|uniref:Uncharacterized protein n=1 Tax=Malassezia brasiliensis TaxID=1821822 RepID=A0AAF0DSN1_9BASI|nr:hypothetical protein MBRA1_001352 [Malassezia brasiliensis]